jgi:hypothetical protein
VSVDVAVATPAFIDVTYVGLEALPRPGEERFARDLVLCREIDAAQWLRRPFWQRIQERIFYYFRLWL